MQCFVAFEWIQVLKKIVIKTFVQYYKLLSDLQMQNHLSAMTLVVDVVVVPCLSFFHTTAQDAEQDAAQDAKYSVLGRRSYR